MNDKPKNWLHSFVMVWLMVVVLLAAVVLLVVAFKVSASDKPSVPARVVPARERHKAEREAERMREGIERIADEMERARVQRLLEGR